MKVRFTDSAFRHGITERSIRSVIDEYGYADEVELTSNPDALGFLFVGDDYRGVPLEIIGIAVLTTAGEEELLIIHAMPLRTRYWGEYERIMRERWG